MQRREMLVPLILLSVIMLSSVSFAANFIDVHANGTTKTNSNITVVGYVYNLSNVTQGIANVTILINFSTLYNNNLSTDDTGLFNATFRSPSLYGYHNVSVTMGSTTKSIPVFVTNVSSGTIEYVNNKPPFAAGDRFTINVTIRNASSDLLENNAVTTEVYSANGARQSWTITNMTNSAVHSGKISYNITIGSSADGNYIISVDKGSVTSVFSIRSGYVMALATQSSSGETKTDFYPGNNVTVIAKIRNTAGDPQTASAISAVFTLPNGSVETYTMQADSANSGYYNVTYITNENQTGRYKVEAEVTVSGQAVKSSSMFNTQTLRARLETQKDFFKEWGNSAAFEAGGDAGLNVIVTNLSNDATLTGSMSGGASYANCSDIQILSVKNAVNGSSVNIGAVTNATGSEMMTQVCRILFTAPSETGFYKITANISVGPTKVTGVGFFSVQKYMLKPEPVSSMGGDMEFMTMLYPGENASFIVSAYNLTSGLAVAGTNIHGVNVTKIVPLEFITGVSDITNISYSVAYPTSAGSDPVVTVMIPENQTGPFLIKMQANISGDIVEGEAFYMSKYVMGYLMSGGGGSMGVGGGGPEGGGGGPGGMGGMSSCRGTETFSGGVYQIKGMQSAASSVSFNNILQARNEMTGEDVKNCLTMVKNSSDTNGQIRIPIAFSSSCSFSGFYFMVLNVTYEGKTDMIPSGFQCANFKFWPSPDNWRKSPDAFVQFNVSSIQRLNDTGSVPNGTLTLIRAMNFNPGSGERVLTIGDTLSANLTNGSASINVYPQNFTGLTRWPSGFMDMIWRFCDTSGVCDTSFGGFQVSPFDLWIQSLNGQYNIWGQTVGAGQNVSFVVAVSTNVSRDSGNYSDVGETTTTGFTVKLGKPWTGKLTTLTVQSAVLLGDNWNNDDDTLSWGMETWNITVNIPASTKKGENMLTIEANGSVSSNNYTGETATTDVWFQIGTYTVKQADQVSFMMYQSGHFYNENTVSLAADVYNNCGIDIAASDISDNAVAADGTMLACADTLYLYASSGSVNHSDTSILVMDNQTSGKLVVLNNSGAIYLLTPTKNWSELYLWKADELGHIVFVNTTNERSNMQNTYSTWGGEYQKGSTFYVPYIVLQAGTNQPMADMNVSINGIIEQNDKGGSSGSGMGGMGFKSKLVENTDYTVVQGRTDSNGLAFVRLNVTNAGKMMAFWKLVSDEVTDISNFNSGTMMAIRAFRAWGSIVPYMRDGGVIRVTLNRINTSDVSNNVWNYTGATEGTFIYNGTFTEGTDTDFIQDGETKSYWMIYDPNVNRTIMSVESNLNITADPNIPNTYINGTLSIGGTSIGVAAFEYSSNNETITMTLYQDSSSGWKDVSSADETVAVKVCAYGYDVSNTPKEGATFYLSYEDWSSWPNQEGNLTMYNSMDDSSMTYGTVGPAGCGVARVIRPGGWREGSISIKGYATYEGDSEETYAGMIGYWSR